MYAFDSNTHTLTNRLTDRRELLRVKIKSLAEEARIIRHEERRTFGELRDSLYLHRIGIVRRAARNSILAYGIIRGLDLEQMEPVSYETVSIQAINKMIEQYGPTDREANLRLRLKESANDRYQARKPEGNKRPRVRQHLSRADFEASLARRESVPA